MEKYGEKKQACLIDHFSLQRSLSVRRDISLPCTELDSIFRKFWNLKKLVNLKSILISTADFFDFLVETSASFVLL